MPEETIQKSKMCAIDDMSAPTILVNGVRGVIVNDRMVTFNLTNVVFVVPEAENKVSGPVDTIVARLAMSVESFVRLEDFFTQQKSHMIADGIINIEADSSES